MDPFYWEKVELNSGYMLDTFKATLAVLRLYGAIRNIQLVSLTVFIICSVYWRFTILILVLSSGWWACVCPHARWSGWHCSADLWREICYRLSKRGDLQSELLSKLPELDSSYGNIGIILSVCSTCRSIFLRRLLLTCFYFRMCSRHDSVTFSIDDTNCWHKFWLVEFP